jgi:Spy/CpxP family protein refolding chaperone
MQTSNWFLKLTAAALLVSGLNLLETTATAAERRGPERRAAVRARVAHALELTPQQRQQIRAVLQAERETLAALLGDLHETRQALRATIRDDDATEQDVLAAAAEVAAVEADLALERQKLRRLIKPILTPAQLEELQAIEERLETSIETARLTGWSSVWVRVRAHRARRKLARILTQLRQASA